jgi:hypothetical protein
MTKNIGSVDRTIRIILGLGIIALGLCNKSWLGLIGLVLLASAFLRWCPAYLPFGISTNKTEQK